MTTEAIDTGRPAPSAGPVGGPVGGRIRPALEMRRDVIGYHERMWREHGDIVKLRIGPPGLAVDVWMLHHPDAAARVLGGSSWTNYSKNGPVYDEIAHWLGQGLLTSQGEEWTRQKRFVQPLFTHAAVDGYGDLMVDEILSVVGDWNVSGTARLDLAEQMQRLTLRVVVRALFGGSADEVVPHVRDSFPVVSDTVMRRGLGAVRLPRSVPTPRVRRGRAAQADLLGVCDRIIADRRAGATSGETDLLGRLVAARDGGEGMTDEEIRDQVLVFLLAGHETTSTALTFALHLLGRRPELQQRVREEFEAALADAPDERPTASTVAALPLTNAVLKETMRLFPSAPLFGRLTVADDELLGQPVPAGTVVVVAPWTIHRHPDFWDDPMTFDPERFLDTDAVKARHRYAWMPFGGGPRACIGQHFSMVEAALALGLVLRDHEIGSVTDSDVLPVGSLITLFPQGEVLADVRRIPR